MRRGSRCGESSTEHSDSEQVEGTWEWDTLVMEEGDLRWVAVVLKASDSTSMGLTTSICSKKAKEPTVKALENTAKGAGLTMGLAVSEAIQAGQETREDEVSIQGTLEKVEVRAGQQDSKNQITSNNLSSRIQLAHHKEIQEPNNTTLAKQQAKIQTKAACKTNNV